VADITKSVQKSVAGAEDKLTAESDAAQTERETRKAPQKYRGRTRAALRRAEQLLKAAEEAAAGFGIAAGTLDTAAAWDVTKALYASTHARAAVYARMADEAQGTAMEAAAAESDSGFTVPLG
jgi:hypothetical protein